jgi:hypothetical protein
MSTYSDHWNDHVPRASIYIHEETRSAKVTYPNPNGGKPFRVMIHQKPNPIGFHAHLPGDKRR